MNGLRVALATVGVAVAAAGLAMVLDPTLAEAVPTSDQVVQVLGVLALAQGGRILWHRYRSEQRAGTVEDPPESPPAGPTPGTDFDDLAAAAADVSTGRTLRSRRNRLRRRLRRAVLATLEQRGDRSREEAMDAIEDGTWTDDPEAAALFTDEVAVDGSSRWLSLSRGGPGSLTHRANRAAFAVADLADVEVDESAVPGDGDRGIRPGVAPDGAGGVRSDGPGTASWRRDAGPEVEETDTGERTSGDARTAELADDAATTEGQP